MIDGQAELQATRPHHTFDLAGRLHLVVFDERSTHGNASRFEKGVGHRPADDEPIDASDKVLNHVELVRHLRAPENRHERAVGRREHAAQVFELLFHQEPGGGFRHEMRDALDRRVGAMGRAERVVDVQLGQGGQLLRELRVVLFFLRMKPEILEQHHTAAAVMGGIDRGFRGLPDAVGRKRHRPTQERRGACGDRFQAVLRIHLPLRASQVRGEHHRCPVIERVANRRERRADTRVVGHLAILERHVEVDAHEHAPTLQIEISDGKLHNYRLLTADCRLSTTTLCSPCRRADRCSGSSSPTRCRTTRGS